MIPFEDFWRGWCPNKRVDKKAARDYWESDHMDDTQRAKAVKAAPVYAAQNSDQNPHYILYPIRWLRNERFEDELPPPPPPPDAR